MMRITLRTAGCICAIFLCVVPLFARGKGDPPGRTLVVASTSWVAAIAEAAGLENVRVLAPVELQHPPEYELKPSDLQLVNQSRVVLYAGWERFAQKLAETAGSAGVELIAVTATGNPDTLIAEAERLSLRFGTKARFEDWKNKYRALTEEGRKNLALAWTDNQAVVQRMQTDLISWLGFTIIGEYGPAEPSPALILELVNLKPALVVDNYHGPSGKPIAEAAKVPYAELINFPGKGGTKTLEDVFRYNMDILSQAAK